MHSSSLLAERRYAWGMAALEDGDAMAAQELFAQALELDPQWAALHFASGKALFALRDVAGARGAFAQCLRLQPSDILGAGLYLERIAHQTQNIKNDAEKGMQSRTESDAKIGMSIGMSSAYVAALFDEYAPRFDAHLTKNLHYQGPELIKALVDRTCGTRHFSRIYDLGCGTGLSGAVFVEGAVDARPRLFGCDLSAKMLHEAQKRGIYQTLACTDILSFLAEQSAQADLIIAIDVLVYCGDLAPYFAAVAAALESGGIFAFSFQEMQPEAQAQTGAQTGAQAKAGIHAGFMLGEDMRYAHAHAYIAQLAAKNDLTIKSTQNASTRMDAGKPVAGLLFVMEKA